MLTFLCIWAILSTVWAIVITVLFFYKPLPFPDRGHRVFGVKDEKHREIVVEFIETLNRKKARLTFDSGKIHQTILNEGFTSIHYIDKKPDDVPASAISMPVKNPLLPLNKQLKYCKPKILKLKLSKGLKPICH